MSVLLVGIVKWMSSLFIASGFGSYWKLLTIYLACEFSALSFFYFGYAPLLSDIDKPIFINSNFKFKFKLFLNI